MLVVLTVRRPFASLFGARPAYALWLLPAGRLLIPPLPAISASSLVSPVEVVVPIGEMVSSLPSQQAASFWVLPLVGLWMAGGAAFLVWQWLAYRRFLTQLSLSSRSLGSHKGLPLVESDIVEGPLALGLLDRRIVVPADLSMRYSEAERQLALDHEAVHHKRGDIWWNLAALFLLAVNWFNPIAWIAFRAYREDQELACDAAVAARATPQGRHDYAQALVKSASRSGQVAACPLNHADQLKRRLKMMNSHRVSRPRLLGGTAAIVLLAGVTASLGSPVVAHPHPDDQAQVKHHERIMIMVPKGSGGEGSARLFNRRIEDGEETLPENCPGDANPLANVDEREGDQRTRILLCTRGDSTAAERAEALERARRHLAEDEHLSTEQRQRITARIDEEIARLRAQ